MSLESYQIIILVSVLLNFINIINSFLLLKSSEFKGGFILIIVALLIISGIQLNDFLSQDFSIINEIVLTPFELISLIGGILLFLILTTFILTRKVEEQVPKDTAYFYRSEYNFYRPAIPKEEANEPNSKSSFNQTKQVDKSQNNLSIQTQPKVEKFEIKEEIEPKLETHQEVKTKEHIKEIPSNGKAVIAKFIKREEPQNETEKIKEELEKIKFQRDKLVSIISHDLRTPLNSVFGYCQLLKEGQYKNKNEVKKFAENIFELSKQQLNALNKIIEWTKYESPNLPLNPTEFDVTSTINFVAKSMSKIAEEKNLKILVNSKPDLYVYGDEFMIIEVLKNLLDNAIKFSHPNSSIEIHTHYHEKINKLVVLVVDSGVGIDREILMNLLVSTKKFTTRGTKGEKGLGLGLLIVKAIIDKHGEHFWIASEEGKWTRVYFTLKPAKINSEN